MRRSAVLLLLAVLAAGGCAQDAPADLDGGKGPSSPPASVGAPTTSPTPFGRTSSPTPAACLASGAIDAAAWTQAEGGRSLAVVPADALRDCAGPLARWDGIPPGWQEVLDLAGPEADSRAMQQQYACHLRFARAKQTWNLEPWRPEVDQETLVRARCNP